MAGEDSKIGKKRVQNWREHILRSEKKIPMKIPESKRSEIGKIAEFCGIQNGFPNLDLQQTMEITSTADGNDTIKKLKARGGRDQLLMLLTGPAGSGKSTAMKVAQQFCYEFCIAVGIMWSDKMFIFTAYTGLAASLFGGVTISKAAFLNQRKQLSVDDRQNGKMYKLS
jgi:hypothetical protein